MAKQRQVKRQMRVGALQAIPELESRSDEELLREQRHRVAARAILGARAAERYDAKTARRYFNEALAGAHPHERPALRQMMKASLALAERRPDELAEAVQKLGQEPPSRRQLMVLRLVGLIAPPPGSSLAVRARAFLLLALIVVLLLAVGAGIAQLAALPFGGVGFFGSVLLGGLIVVAVIAVLALMGRRRQGRLRERQRERLNELRERARP
ncbi:hypothetical protein [Thermoleophilum album]|uniref:Uncharacterized protein n=1 Tax=Thermoleophilum album TaxID=29539 RepID=A0A1H6FWD0_THEAL|nr:hypothetical protein [Thermoleophilum album]SEH14478.1 hypothetical protein SAMN02745716_1645 [Thermoleophilum album]